MVKVRILSGNHAGHVVEMDALEAQVNVDTGYACYADPPGPTPESTLAAAPAEAAEQAGSEHAGKKAKGK